MKKIKFVSRRRGFFNHLENREDISFLFSENSFEVPTLKRRIGSRMIRSNLISLFGTIQRIEDSKSEDEEVLVGSFNRFLKTKNDYFIYLENPTALYHYTLNRNKTLLGKRNFQNYLEDEKLKYFICMSYACKESINEVFYPSNSTIKSKVIYPLVKDNLLVDEEKIKLKKNRKKLKLLFIALGSRFISKGGLEVIEVMKKVKSGEIECTIITNINQLDKEIVKEIEKIKNINLLNFGFSYEQMESIYYEHDVLIHPSSDDSFGLTLLEAMKAGLPIITTSLYAFPEMVINKENGFLTDPKWQFFDENNIPNPLVWNNRKNTLFNKVVSDKLISFLLEKIVYFEENRDEVVRMSLNSYNKSMKEPFSEEFIMRQWDELYDEIKFKNEL